MTGIRVEKVAINAVMAGCKPEYFPVVLAMVEAMMVERYGIHAANASTGSMAVGYIANGPVRTVNVRPAVRSPNTRA